MIPLLGAIAGDILGSPYEGKEGNPRAVWSDESRFTDDTVLLLAIAEAIMLKGDPSILLYEFYQKYPRIGYGNKFSEWAWFAGNPPYLSMGNGSAMRAPACGWAANSWSEAMQLGKWSALPTHNHRDGIRGAQAVSLAVYLLRKGYSKVQVAWVLRCWFGYKFRNVKQPDFEPSTAICTITMPLALQALIVGNTWEEVVLTAINYGGDTDTNACIAGALAEVIYPVPKEYQEKAWGKLDNFLRDILKRFMNVPRKHG